jgi:hypothetical protein
VRKLIAQRLRLLGMSDEETLALSLNQLLLACAKTAKVRAAGCTG